jgi:RNA polymerase sigma-70 factor (ECF subfamily)
MEQTLEMPQQVREQEDFAAAVMALDQNLYRLALSMLRQPDLAEDAVAETVCRAYAARHRLRDREKLKPWLFQILVNQCRSIQRRQGREVAWEALAQEPAAPESRSGLWDLVRQLPEGQQAVVVLYYYEGYSTKEIAKLLRVQESTVRVRMKRGRDTLRQWLEDDDGTI